MLRSIVLIPLLVLLALTWGRSPVPVSSRDDRLVFDPEPLPPRRVLAEYLGPFRLEEAWHVRSDNALFYGYSSLVPQGDGELLAFSDAGGILRFTPPGAGIAKAPLLARVGFHKWDRDKTGQDVESAVRRPDGGYWLGLEGYNQIVRIDARLRETGRVRPKLMQGWGLNTGPEAMARLNDGRFIAIREITLSLFEPRLHEAVLFDGDPVDHPEGHRFWFDGPDNFSVVDMTMLADGRALVLMRRLIAPLPLRFAGRIAIIDTKLIRAGGVVHAVPLASLASTLPVDNFEAITAIPRPDGRVTVWIMSDDNNMRVAQRTLLWKLSVDPKALPQP